MLSIYCLSKILVEWHVLRLHFAKSGNPTKEEIHIENVYQTELWLCSPVLGLHLEAESASFLGVLRTMATSGAVPNLHVRPEHFSHLSTVLMFTAGRQNTEMFGRAAWLSPGSLASHGHSLPARPVLGQRLPLSSLICEAPALPTPPPDPHILSHQTWDTLLDSSRMQPMSGRALHSVRFLALDSHGRTVVLLQSADKAQASPDFYLVSVM